MHAKLVTNKGRAMKPAIVVMTFPIPYSLAMVLKSKELIKDQKINLVKSYTEDVNDENGKKMEQIPVQHGVSLIMALEMGAL